MFINENQKFILLMRDTAYLPPPLCNKLCTRLRKCLFAVSTFYMLIVYSNNRNVYVYLFVLYVFTYCYWWNNQRNSDPRGEHKMDVFGLHEQHLVGALFLTIVAFILGLIGFGTPYWYYKSETGCTRYGGLWHTCTTIGLSTTCFDMVDSQEGK